MSLLSGFLCLSVIAVIGVTLLAVHCRRPDLAAHSWLVVTLAFLAPFALLWGSVALESLIEVSLAVAAAAAYIQLVRRRTGQSLFPLLAIGLVVLLTAVSVFNSNVPSLYLYAQGARRTLLFLAAVAIGLAVDRFALSRRVGQVAIGFLAGSLLIALAQQLGGGADTLIPLALQQKAGVATQELFGLTRSTGPFAGPFHLAILGMVAMVVILRADLLRRERILGAILASVVIMTTLVRTSLIGICAIALVYLAMRHRPKPGRLLLAGVLLVASVVVVLAAIPYLAPTSWTPQNFSLGNIASDQRLTGRFDAMSEAVDLVAERPLAGWGPGSAADTVATDFIERGSVGLSPHNMWLKYGVELGFVGMLAVVGLTVWFVVMAFRGEIRDRWTALLLLAGAAPFALSGTFVDALPPALVVGIVLGWSLAPEPSASGGEGYPDRTRHAEWFVASQ